MLPQHLFSRVLAVVMCFSCQLFLPQCWSFVVVTSSLHRHPSALPSCKGSDKLSQLDWIVVDEYPYIPEDGLARFLERTNDVNIEIYCQRLQVTETNMTVPVALMILDSVQFPTLSKSRKACRQGKILWKPLSVLQDYDVGPSPEPTTALVGDRFLPGKSRQILARRETRQALSRQDPENHSKEAPTAQSTSFLEYDIPSLVQPPFQLSVVYEDDCMAIVDKPAGVLNYPEAGKGRNNVLFALPYYLQRPQGNSFMIASDDDTILKKPVPVHRLDFVTSGLLVIAKTKFAARFLAEQFEFRKTRKTYVAMVYGVPRPEDGWKSTTNAPQQNDSGMILRIPWPDNADRTAELKGYHLADCYLEGKRATTWWRIIESYHYVMHDDTKGGIPMSVCMIEMNPSTGRYHQLRRQMAFLYGTPIIGDPIYAKEYVERTFSDTATLNRYHRGLMLCSNEIEIAHPFFNTPRGKEQWVVNSANTGPGAALGASLHEDETGHVIVKATLNVPLKFTKFRNSMEKMTKHVTTFGNDKT